MNVPGKPQQVQCYCTKQHAKHPKTVIRCFRDQSRQCVYRTSGQFGLEIKNQQILGRTYSVLAPMHARDLFLPSIASYQHCLLYMTLAQGHRINCKQHAVRPMYMVKKRSLQLLSLKLANRLRLAVKLNSHRHSTVWICTLTDKKFGLPEVGRLL